MVLVKPATVLQWHRQRFYWRWRACRLGRPKMSLEIRNLIRKMSLANRLWGAPRIHGELLQLGIKVSESTVGRYMPWRPKVPSPTWCSFLHNHLTDITAIEMLVVATPTFRLLHAPIVLGLDRRRVIHFGVTENPTQDWLSRQMAEAFPWDTAPRYLLRDIWSGIPRSRPGDGNQAGCYCTAVSLAESVCGAPHRLNPPRMLGSHNHLQREALAQCPVELFSISSRSQGHISRLTGIVRSLAAYSRPLQARSSRFRRWVVCIIATNVALPDLRGHRTDTSVSA
jgi:hypothetical protein